LEKTFLDSYMPMFTVRQLSKLAGVTPRALRHYDDIGLLDPSRIGENGYRCYRRI
jgi:DNA-binding transcriptional MerR regulator